MAGDVMVGVWMEEHTPYQTPWMSRLLTIHRSQNLPKSVWMRTDIQNFQLKFIWMQHIPKGGLSGVLSMLRCLDINISNAELEIWLSADSSNLNKPLAYAAVCAIPMHTDLTPNFTVCLIQNCVWKDQNLGGVWSRKSLDCWLVVMSDLHVYKLACSLRASGWGIFVTSKPKLYIWWNTSHLTSSANPIASTSKVLHNFQVVPKFGKHCLHFSTSLILSESLTLFLIGCYNSGSEH